MICIKYTIIFCVLLRCLQPASAQPSTDSLLHLLGVAAPDTNKVSLYSTLAIAYMQTNNELAIRYAREGIVLAKQLNFKRGEADCTRRMGIAYFIQGRYPEALDIYQRALGISETINDAFGIAAGNGHIGNIYAEQGDEKQARFYYDIHYRIASSIPNRSEQANAMKRIGESYLREGKLDSALIAFNKVNELLQGPDGLRFAGGRAGILQDFGEVEARKGNRELAMSYFRQAIPHALATNNINAKSGVYLEMARLYQSVNKDSGIYYATQSLTAAKENRFAKNIVEAGYLLAELYQDSDPSRSLHYYKMSNAINDSLFTTAKATQVHNLFFLQQQRQQEVELSRTRYNNRLKLYSLLTVAFVFLLLAILLYRNNRNKQKANLLLSNQKKEIQERRAQAEKALDDLKAAQSQLIQSEKMASLGQLTAGIAHEIQNPLNFVNNFSEINSELIEELKSKKEKLGNEEADDLLADIFQNNEKINLHGRRADSIVKGMLQHSRTSTGQQELTDINALADEYLRLAYHGFRAKEKSFNATITTDFDPGIGNIKMISQETGRVLLNLYNNAFYAMNEKAKSVQHYEPAIVVSAKKHGNNVLISVKDNGNGIPGNIIDKIFQPFFTTKPTGEGTGLGLSLSYESIKAQGGDIKVNSVEGEFTQFIVLLPVR